MHEYHSKLLKFATHVTAKQKPLVSLQSLNVTMEKEILWDEWRINKVWDALKYGSKGLQ